MRLAIRPLLPAAFAVLLANAVFAQQPFEAGWYIVQPSAEFAVVQLAGSEISGDSITDAQIYEQVGIAAGEVVLALEYSSGTYLVLEWFGRLSAVRGENALEAAPAGGRPAFLAEDVQFLDRVVSSGSTVWVTDIDAGAGTAIIVLDGGRRESVTSRSVSVLMNAYSRLLPQLNFKPIY